ncbi:MAG: DNA adenine methylase [Chloroflexota bacterium]
MYIEPFVGAGAVLFDLLPTHAIICDRNELLITTYRVIRDDVEALIAQLAVHQHNHGEAYFYRVRAMDHAPDYATLDDVAKAARLLYLNRTCFNGLYRVNRSGFFNTPFGHYANPTICDADVLRDVHTYLTHANVTIVHGSYESAIADAQPGSVVYFDPPYHSPDKRNFTSYAAEGFGEQDQIALARHFAELSQRGVHCLLSNADTPLMHELYAGFHIDVIPAKRAINSNAAARGAVNEVLIRNW